MPLITAPWYVILFTSQKFRSGFPPPATIITNKNLINYWRDLHHMSMKWLHCVIVWWCKWTNQDVPLWVHSSYTIATQFVEINLNSPHNQHNIYKALIRNKILYIAKHISTVLLFNSIYCLDFLIRLLSFLLQVLKCPNATYWNYLSVYLI